MFFRVAHIVFAAASLTSLAAAQSSLETGFLNPPNSAKPHTWWHWINGNISKAGITADLEAMKKIGIGGAQIFNVEVGIPEGKTPMMTPQWQEAMAFAFKEAKRLGIEICVHNCGGWSSSGGPWVKPEYAMQALTWSETSVSGSGRKTIKLAVPDSKHGYYKDVAVFAVRKPSADSFRIANIRAKAAFDRGDKIAPESKDIPSNAVIPMDDVKLLELASDGTVTWNVPEGDWIVLRMGHTPTGAVNAPSPTSGRGLEVDKMSRDAMDHFWAGIMPSLIKDNGPIGKYGLNNALVDSYEVGSQNWTPKFREEFKKRRGYDPLPYLPAITGRVVRSGETTERFLWDWRRTICDLFADNYFQYFKELCHKNGLQFSVEGYGNGSFDNLQVSGLGDVPMGEFWVGGWTTETTKLASSAAHTNGKPVIGAESFTADDVRGRWLVDPYSIKALGDRVFTLGVNRYIFHRYTHQPWPNLEPGMTMGPWGMNLERTITWWDQGAAWMKYIARCQYLLQSGRFVADVVAFNGEEGPNDLPMMKGTLVPEGYDYDGCDATVLHKMKVENGEIVLPTGMRYRVLLLPDSKWMTPKTLRKIQELVKQGATIIGPKPTKSPSLADAGEGDASLVKIADQVWASKNVFTGKTVKQVLDARKILPDLSSTKPVNWIHRKIGNTEVYFVSNPAYRPTDIDVTFRVKGKLPELWNAETGTTSPASIWREQNGRTTVSLHLESAGSTFVVFRSAAKAPHFTSMSFTGSGANEFKPPKVEILSAKYESVDGAGSIDVTQKVRDMIARGETEVGATNANFGDPFYMHVKRLRMVYTIDGKRFERNLDENQSFDLVGPGGENVPPDYILIGNQVQAWKPGKFDYKLASGWSGSTTAKPVWTMIQGPWKLSFPAGKGAPSSVTMDQLDSWTNSSDNGVKYFSGTATYQKSFDVASINALGGSFWLDLGRVKNFADVELNGHKFETLWKAPFRLDVTKWLKKGKNSLTVRVTNLWPNRLIGDEKYAPQGEYKGGPIAKWPQWILDGGKRPASERTTFATWKFFNQDSPLLESGLIGPVKLVRTYPVSYPAR